MQMRLERLVDEMNKPILMGNTEDIKSGEWRNGVFWLNQNLLSEKNYTKRELVPFGEYVPRPFGFIRKVVPLNGSFVPGDDVGLIDVIKPAHHLYWILVCYEDAFPALASRARLKVLNYFLWLRIMHGTGRKGERSSMPHIRCCAQ